MVSFNKKLLLTFRINLNPSTNQDAATTDSISRRAPREAEGNQQRWHTWQRCLPRGAAPEYLQENSNLTVSTLISPRLFPRVFQGFPSLTQHNAPASPMCVLFCSSPGV